MKYVIIGLLLFLLISCSVFKNEPDILLENDYLKIGWYFSEQGYKIGALAIKTEGQWKTLPNPLGEYTLLRAETKPEKKSDKKFQTIVGKDYPEEIYSHQVEHWKKEVGPVSLNFAGEVRYFFPDQAQHLGKDKVIFSRKTEWGMLSVTWSLDPKFPGDVLIEQKLDVTKDGFYSLSSPSLLTIPEAELEWATVPGYFHGTKLEDNLVLGYAYGNGVPAHPIVFSEQTATTLSPMVSSKKGFTVAVISNPELGRNPWEKDEYTHMDWRVGLSHMNRKKELSPSLYYPVLGEIGSEKKKGESIDFGYRFSLSNKDWFEVLKHAVYDVFEFEKGLILRKNKQSLTERVNAMYGYLSNPLTSLWRVEEFEGKKIGAQAYYGGVVGSDKDAMKNADYGAMWMLASATGSPYLKEKVLPFALNFKLTQQQTAEGFFKGAAIGQYYLSKSRMFVEEWGKMVEPIALTYYIMLDIGNILLFEPENEGLKERLRLGADLLLDWQKEDGSWAVAYNREEEEIFKDLKDFRPTFYGLLVAHRVLKDQKYLDAAKRGADWYLENGVSQGSFLGVCGDARYVPDFATGQTAQAYLDLFDLTKDKKYKDAAIQAAKIYTTSVYTHPIPNQEIKTVNGKQIKDWEISQAGLSVEHGGTMGSANTTGPILLASHAGMFIRMHRLTGERIFADMARAAAIGRHAFVDPKTSVATYYWRKMDLGPGPYPHHAWWQIGWITDYLMAETELRSKGKIVFPRGFIAPKVGPHQSYGFAAGSIFGQKANLKIAPHAVTVSNPSIEYVITSSPEEDKLWVILLNQENELLNTELKIDFTAFRSMKISGVKILDENGSQVDKKNPGDNLKLSVPGLGLSVIQFDL